jgi:hypothetical protein
MTLTINRVAISNSTNTCKPSETWIIEIVLNLTNFNYNLTQTRMYFSINLSESTPTKLLPNLTLSSPTFRSQTQLFWSLTLSLRMLSITFIHLDSDSFDFGGILSSGRGARKVRCSTTVDLVRIMFCLDRFFGRISWT